MTGNHHVQLRFGRSARLVDYYDQGPMAEAGRGPGATVEIVGMGLPICMRNKLFDFGVATAFNVSHTDEFVDLRRCFPGAGAFQGLRRRDRGVPIGSVPSS